MSRTKHKTMLIGKQVTKSLGIKQNCIQTWTSSPKY